MSERESSFVRLGVFAALAAFAASHWVTLVSDPPAGGTAGVVAIAVAGGAALILIANGDLDRRIARLSAVAVAVAVTAAALVAIGLPAALLDPERWDDLGNGIGHGFLGISDEIDYPYDGGNAWSRRVLLFGLPLLLAAAAAVAFWPRSDPKRARIAPLVILVGGYAVATAANRGGSLLTGLVLLALIGAWLWLPSLSRARASSGAKLLALTGLAALPLAAVLDAENPWLDYTSWDLSGPKEAVEFQWDHSYGPLDWPRDGTALFEAESEVPHYWRTMVLDEFDGFRWMRSGEYQPDPLELPTEVAGDPRARPGRELNSRWMDRVEVTVGGLGGDLLVAPGSARAVEGIAADRTPDGTTFADETLDQGDTYAVRGYAPEPDFVRLRRAPQQYPPDLSRYTVINLPGEQLSGAEGNTTNPIFAFDTGVQVPLWGTPADPEVEQRLRGSAYARIYRLARRLTAGEATVADAAGAIEIHLQSKYRYAEDPPKRPLPLAAFLFEDRQGYCQHFSGAMALMLRMLGIPSRVATGFAPGEQASAASGANSFVIRDFDAHSWVEVYFPGIGWTPFDPTPGGSPAADRASELGLSGFGDAQETGANAEESGARRRAFEGPQPGASGSSGGAPTWVIAAAIVLAGLVIALLVLVALRALRYRSLAPAASARAQVGEIEAALPRLGFPLPGGITLLGLERRLGRARPATTRYVAKLRSIRYGAGGGPGPTLAERRKARRELSSGRGLRRRLQGLLALPPGGPGN